MNNSYRFATEYNDTIYHNRYVIDWQASRACILSGRAFLCCVAFCLLLHAQPPEAPRPRSAQHPNLGFACELKGDALGNLLADGTVVEDLAELGASVSLALPQLTPEVASLVHRLNQASIPVTAWLVLSFEQGYFLNAGNAAAAMKRFDQFQTWTSRYDLTWAGIGLDIEPDFAELQSLSQGGSWRLVPVLIQRAFDHQRLRSAKQAYQALVQSMQSRGYRVETYQFFFMADERRARSTLLERMLGVVDIRTGRECLMLYTSFHHSWGASVIFAYGGNSPVIAIGSTGGDSKLDAGFAPLNWNEFIRDLAAARYWTNDIGVYSLEGCVRQGFLSRLKTVDWNQAYLPPPRSLIPSRVDLIRTGIAVLLWADNLAYVILGLIIAWLIRRIVRSRMRLVSPSRNNLHHEQPWKPER